MISTVKAYHREPNRQRAFTLVEVLATLALVAIILPVAMEGISLATTMAGVAKQKMEAASLAETTLAELLATGAWQNGDLSGDFGPEQPQYHWIAEVRDWEGTTLRRMDVHVQWTARGRERSVTLTTLVYTGNQ